MTHPGPPGPPQGVPRPGPSAVPSPARGPGAPAPAPARAGRGWRIGGIVGALAVTGGVAAVRFLDVGAPGVGDCVRSTGGPDFETVACQDSAAELRVVGIEADEVTELEFYDDAYLPCTEFDDAVQALWRGGNSGDGTVYCFEPVT